MDIVDEFVQDIRKIFSKYEMNHLDKVEFLTDPASILDTKAKASVNHQKVLDCDRFLETFRKQEAERNKLVGDLARDVGLLRAQEMMERQSIRGNLGYRDYTSVNRRASLAYESVEAIKSGDLDRMREAFKKNQELLS